MEYNLKSRDRRMPFWSGTKLNGTNNRDKLTGTGDICKRKWEVVYGK